MRKLKLSLGLQIIGAGFPRTGTTSLKFALERLGFGPCYHMQEVATQGASHAAFWQNAAIDRAADWASALGGYRAAVDMPAAAFYGELLATWPSARVILTVREAEAWYRSVRQTVYTLRRVRRPGAEAFDRMVEAVFWEGILGGRFDEPEHALAVYGRHAAEVKSRVPAEQLLLFDVAQGWVPLCAFLDVPVPDEPFPHANDAVAFHTYLRIAVGLADATGDTEEARLQMVLAEFSEEIVSDIRRARPL